MSKLQPEDFYFANNQTYLEHRPKVLKELIEHEKEYKPRACVCCFMFRWLFGEDGKICGGKCAAKQEIEKEKIIEKGKALEAAHERRVEGCPLEDDADER